MLDATRVVHKGRGLRKWHGKKIDPELLPIYERVFAQQEKRAERHAQRVLANRLRTRLRYVVRSDDEMSARFVWAVVGCDRVTLMRHIESQFKPGMSWDNPGSFEIDHITPCKAYDMSDPEQQRACFHYTNLQPLTCHENRVKGAKLGAKLAR